MAAHALTDRVSRSTCGRPLVLRWRDICSGSQRDNVSPTCGPGRRSTQEEAPSHDLLRGTRIARRVLVIGLGVVLLDRGAALAAPVLSDMALGSPTAPLTIIEYASMTSAQCAAFHRAVLPRLRAEYIDKGKVRLVYRDFPLDAAALRAATLARCAGEQRYFAFLETFYEQQTVWANTMDPLAALERIARSTGMMPAEIKACLSNREVEEYALESRLQAQSRFGIFGTPSFVIEGRTYKAIQSFEDLKRIIDPLLAARTAPSSG